VGGGVGGNVAVTVVLGISVVDSLPLDDVDDSLPLDEVDDLPGAGLVDTSGSIVVLEPPPWEHPLKTVSRTTQFITDTNLIYNLFPDKNAETHRACDNIKKIKNFMLSMNRKS